MLCSSSSGGPCHRRASTSPRAAEAEATADSPSSSGWTLFLASNSLSNYGRSHSKPEVSRLIIESTHSSSQLSFSSPKVHLRSQEAILNGLLEVRHPVSCSSRSLGSEWQLFAAAAAACHLLVELGASFLFRTCNTIIRILNVMALGCLVTQLGFDFENRLN